MITVITGMEIHPFDRLVKAVDSYVGNGHIHEPVFIQRGHTPYLPKYAGYEDFVSFGDLCEKVLASDIVITHAGAGSTLTCLQHGKRPIVVPRQHRFGEHIDDHQLPFAQRLHDFGMVHQVLDLKDLPSAIDAARERSHHAQNADQASGMVQFLQSSWETLAERARRTPKAT